MVDWTGQAQEAADRVNALERQRARVAEVVAQLDRLRQADLPALDPVHWRSEAQRRYSDQLAELHGILAQASAGLDRAVEALDQALRSAPRGP